MTWVIVVLTAAAVGLAAWALTPWMRRVARANEAAPERADSVWLGSGLHAVLALLGGAGAALLASSWVELVAFSLLALACALLVVIDLASHRLPNSIVAPMYPIMFVTLVVGAAISGNWDQLGRAAAGAGVVGSGYLLLAWIAPTQLGLGDVKLSGLLGLFLGWLGWPQLLMGTLAAFVLNGLVAALLLLLRRASRRSSLAFGPWMVAGAALGATWGSVALLSPL